MSDKYQDRIPDASTDTSNHPDDNMGPPKEMVYDYSIRSKDVTDATQPKSTDGRQMLEDRKNK